MAVKTIAGSQDIHLFDQVLPVCFNRLPAVCTLKFGSVKVLNCVNGGNIIRDGCLFLQHGWFEARRAGQIGIGSAPVLLHMLQQIQGGVQVDNALALLVCNVNSCAQLTGQLVGQDHDWNEENHR